MAQIGVPELLIIGVICLIPVVLVIGVIVLVRGTGRRAGDARAILDERYARGEITREEYTRILEDLGRQGPDKPAGP